MEHKGTQTLHTPRLILRQFRVEDAPAAFRNWTHDDAVTRYLSWPVHTHATITEMVLKDWVASYEKPDFYQWAIEFQGQPIGSISVVEQDDRVEKAEIGYCIGRAWWNQGITSEAVQAVLDYLFDQVGYNRIQARHDVRNPNSGKVMTKCGMKAEGLLRAFDKNNQGICDTVIYGILAQDR